MPVEYNIEFDTQHDYILRYFVCALRSYARARYDTTRVANNSAPTHQNIAMLGVKINLILDQHLFMPVPAHEIEFCFSPILLIWAKSSI